jgi:hypothetical protein
MKSMLLIGTLPLRAIHLSAPATRSLPPPKTAPTLWDVFSPPSLTDRLTSVSLDRQRLSPFHPNEIK